MINRFVQASVLAVSTMLFGSACNRAADTSALVEDQTVPSCTPPVEMPAVSHQWDQLILGSSELPQNLARTLQDASREEDLAMNPCNSIREHVVMTVSSERHYRNAYGHYQEVLAMLDQDYRPEIRRRVRDKMSTILMSIETLNDMNCRYLTASSCTLTATRHY